MLIFLDAEKFVRVLRTEANGERRVRVGVIMKNTFEMKSDENATLSEAEVAEIKTVIASYLEVEQAQRRLDIRRFPQILRQVTEHYQAGADEFEKRQISMALAEAQRLIRRVERNNSPSLDRESIQNVTEAGAETGAFLPTTKRSRGRR